MPRHRPLRSHQARIAALVAAIAEGETDGMRDILAAVTPGGGKSLLPEPPILVTMAMAYEGLDAPEVAVVAALMHIRSRPWLEQMIARATRVDPNAGPHEGQRALVFHPDDPPFATFRRRVETERGTLAKKPEAARQGSLLPDWLLHQLAERGPREGGIVPLASNALGLRYATLKPGPSFAAALDVPADGTDRRPARSCGRRPPQKSNLPMFSFVKIVGEPSRIWLPLMI